MSAQISSALPLHVEAWGQNYGGQATVSADLTNVIAIAAGYDHNLALRSDGTVVAWGGNSSGQTNVPGGLANVKAVSASQQSMALRSNGTVVVWGHPVSAVTTVPFAATNVTAIAAGYNYNLALRNDGVVIAWGNSSYGVTSVPGGLSGVTAISAADYHCLALKSDGTVAAWGDNSFGRATVPGGLSGVAAIAAGQEFNLALKSNGTVVAWGNNNYGQTNVSALNNVIAISAGANHALALKADGSVAAWGYSGGGYATVPAGLSGVVAISAGRQHNLALATVPQISIVSQPQNLITNAGATAVFSVAATCSVPLSYQWQKNGTNISGANGSSLALASVQSVDEADYRVIVSHASASVTSSVATLTIGPPPSMATSPQSTTAHIGGNAFFAATVNSSLPLTCQWLRNGTHVINVNSPTLVLGNIQAADAGTYELIATSAAGSVTSAPASLILVARPVGAVVTLGGPAVPSGMTNVIAVAVGSGPAAVQSVALRNDGTIAAWGGGPSGENAIVPSGLSNVVAIAAGQDSNLALKNDGTVVAWGFSPLAPPAGLSNVVAIAARNRLAFALKTDGIVVQWGNGSAPAGLSNVVVLAAGAALKNDGQLVVWETPLMPSAPMTLDGLSNVVGVAIGQGYGLTVRTSGALTYGDHFTGGPFYAGPTNLPGFSNVTAVAAFDQGLALKQDSTLLGYNTTLPTGLTNVIAISAGYGHSLLVVSGGPAILTHPASLTVNGGEPAAFSVVAGGAEPLTYQWRKDGTNLASATGSSFTITNAQSSDAGIFSVAVSNPGGTTVSQPASLSVTLAPEIITSPRSETVFSNALVTLNVEAAGAVPRSYQWWHGGQLIAGATDSSFTIASANGSDAGSYTVVISNSYDVITSAPVTLTLTAHAFVTPLAGTVVSLGGPMVPPGLTNVVTIAASAGLSARPHSVAVRADGTVIAWGGSLAGHDAAVPAGLSNVVAVAAAQDFSLALKRDGTIVSWGEFPLPPPGGLFGTIAINARDRMALALKSDGTVVQWGSGSAPANLSNVVSLAACGAVRNDGTLVVWPSPFPSSAMTLNGLSNVIGASIGYGIGLALRSDGSVTFGDNITGGPFYVGPTNLPSFSNVVAVSAYTHGLALKNDGTVLGVATTIPPGVENITAISAGYGYSLLIATNPPAPLLGARSAGENVSISSPVSVSGYVLESADTPTGPFTVIETFTNAPASSESIEYPQSGPKKYFRLRKL